MARLDRLAPVKEVAQIGATIGREFSYEVLAAVAGQPDEHLRDALDQLVAAGLIFRRGARPQASFVFKHALVQDTAYGTLLRGRRQELHATIARVLEERSASRGYPCASMPRCSRITGSGPRSGRGRSATRWRRPSGRKTLCPT